MKESSTSRWNLVRIERPCWSHAEGKRAGRRRKPGSLTGQRFGNLAEAPTAGADLGPGRCMGGWVLAKFFFITA